MTKVTCIICGTYTSEYKNSGICKTCVDSETREMVGVDEYLEHDVPQKYHDDLVKSSRRGAKGSARIKRLNKYFKE